MRALLVGIMIGSVLAGHAGEPVMSQKGSPPPIKPIPGLFDGVEPANSSTVFHAPLYGIKGIKVNIELEIDQSTDPNMPSASDLKNMVELQLRIARIPVVDNLKTNQFELKIAVDSFKDEGQYISACKGNVSKFIIDDSRRSYGTLHLWDGQGAFGLAGSAKVSGQIKDWVEHISTEFANEYLKEQGM